MDQVQTFQRPIPMNGPMYAPNPMVEKKSGWLKWLIIILVVLIIGGFVWWLFTP